MEAHERRNARISLSSFKLLDVAKANIGFFCQFFLSKPRGHPQSIEVFSKGTKDLNFHQEIIPALS